MSKTTSFGYDLNGNTVIKTLGNGLLEKRSHDARNRVSTTEIISLTDNAGKAVTNDAFKSMNGKSATALEKAAAIESGKPGTTGLHMLKRLSLLSRAPDPPQRPRLGLEERVLVSKLQ